MGFNKKFFTTGGIVASSAAPAAAGLDPLQNFETVTYTGNGGTQKITGYIRKGGAFNGSSSEIQIAATATTPFDSSDKNFSVSLWFNLSSNTNDQVIIGKWTSSIERGWQIATKQGANGNTINLYERSGGTGYIYTNTNPYTLNTWHHLVYVRNSTEAIIYIDGQADTFSANYVLNDGSTSNIQIGRQQNASGTWLNGKVDQVRFFNTALPATGTASVDALYGETYADATKSTTDIFGDGSGVALYELDEDASDTGVAIDSGQSAVFNGSNSAISVSATSTTPVDFSQRNYSLSFWANTTTTTQSAMLSKYGDSDSARSFITEVRSSGIVRHYERGTGTFEDTSTTTTINDGNWHHIVVTKSSSQTIIYIDGTPDVTNSNTFTSNNGGTEDFRIGRDNPASPAWFNGKIDQVRIYSSALSSGDVTNLYNESSVPTANLVAHYKLDGDATDETTNYDGTWGGTEAYSDPAGIFYNGTPTNVNFLGMAFQPDLVWIKDRDDGADQHAWFDSIRGATKRIFSSSTSEETTTATTLTSFDSNGFSLSSSPAVNQNGNDFVAWCWKAADTTTTISAGTVGNTIASDVRANTAAGFSIVKYSGNSTIGATIAHGLSAPLDLLIVKNLDDGTQNWRVQASPLGGTKGAILNTTDAFATASYWNNTDASDTVFTVDNSSKVNSTGDEYIAYCFHSTDYQKVGSYTGNGNANKEITGLGFSPRFVMIKNAGDIGSWIIHSKPPTTTNPSTTHLRANSIAAEDTGVNERIDFDSDGFTLVGTGQNINHSDGDTYIYLAIA